MYYEERMINGIMHYRTNPNDEFKPYGLKELSSRYKREKAEKMDAMNQAWLGNATTAELMEEIRTRVEMDGRLDYKTVDDV